MGPRQIGILKRALRELYLAEGVISQPAHRRAAQGQQQSKPEGVLTDLDVAELLAARVRYGRGGNTSLQVGQLVTTLAPFDRQSLAVHRSKMVTMTGLYARLEQIHQMMDPRDQNRQALEGLLLRLDVFQQGTLAEMFSDENGLAIEELGYLGEEPAIADRWGLTILEGGAMDEYGKIVLLGLAAWHLYQDAVARRREAVGGQYNRPLDIIFEEANKILGGASSAGEGEGGTVGGNDRQFQVMWRDGRKYGIFLHPLLQTVHELPAGIMASCTNAFFGQLKNLKDRDLALGHLAWSEKGFTDEEYKRFMSRIPIAQAICKLGYTQDVALLQPMLIRPLMVPATEPNDAQVEEIFSKPTELKTSSVPAGVAVPPRV